MSRPRTRFHAGRNQSQRVKPFAMFLGDSRYIHQDKTAAAGIRGVTVSSIAWESMDDTVDLGAEELADSVGSVVVSPNQVGIHYVKATTTYSNGEVDVDLWRLEIRKPDFVYTPACPSLLSPANGVTVGGETNATLTWSPIVLATSYQVYVWADGDAKPDTPTASVTDTTYLATGLTAGTTYNWSVDSVSGSQVSDGCSSRTFTAYNVLCPALTSPSNGATLATSNSATLDWAASVAAVSYEVYLWADGDPEPSVPTAMVSAPMTQYDASGLDDGVTYHWKVIAVGSASRSSGCTERTFTTLAIPENRIWLYSNVVAGTDFTTTSTSYVDLLDAASGNPFILNIPKQAGTDFLICVGGAWEHSANPGEFVVGFQADDGAMQTDYDVIDYTEKGIWNVDRAIEGQRLITGLPAGDWIFKIRIRTVTAGTLSTLIGYRCFIRVFEFVPP